MTFFKEGHVTQNSIFTVPCVSFTKKEREKDVKQERIVAKSKRFCAKIQSGSCKTKANGPKNQGAKKQKSLERRCRSTSAKPAVRRSPQQRTPQVHQTEIKTVKTLKLTQKL